MTVVLRLLVVQSWLVEPALLPERAGLGVTAPVPEFFTQEVPPAPPPAAT